MSVDNNPGIANSPRSYILLVLVVAAQACLGTPSASQTSSSTQASSVQTSHSLGVNLGSSLSETLSWLGQPDWVYPLRGFDVEGVALVAHEAPHTLELVYEEFTDHLDKTCPECPPFRLTIIFRLRADEELELQANSLGVVARVLATPAVPWKLLPEHVEMLFGRDYLAARQPVEDPDCVDVCASKRCFGDQGSSLWLYEATNVRVDWVEYEGAITHSTGLSLDWQNVRLPACED